MNPLATLGDAVTGGVHPHGSLGPAPSPGTIIGGSPHVFCGGRAVARDGDPGHSPACCGGVGVIVVRAAQQKVFVDGRPAVAVGAPSVHCGVAPGRVASGNVKVFVP